MKLQIFSRACPKCNKQISYTNKHNLTRAINNNSICQTCHSFNMNEVNDNAKENNPLWKGYKGVGYHWFSKYFERGNRKNKHTGNITIQDAYNKLEAQNFRCALSGINLPWSEASGMSIDRINSKIGYELDNIQLVHKDVNLMKNYFDQDYFISICKLIVENTSEANNI